MATQQLSEERVRLPPAQIYTYSECTSLPGSIALEGGGVAGAMLWMWAGDVATRGVLPLLVGGLSGERSVRGGGGDSCTVSCGTHTLKIHTCKDVRSPEKHIALG